MLKVIDVSSWQETIDWQAVKDDGVDGVILKIGEDYTLDECFIQHVNGAVAVGLQYGIYYYAHAKDVEPAEDEALWVDKQVKTYLNGINPALGIWYDAEDKDMQGGDVTACVSKFISTLNGLGYNYVGVYSSYNWLSRNYAHVIDLNRLADYVPVWVAQYDNSCDLIPEVRHQVKMWQYTDHETVAGISGGVDCNDYYE